MQPDLLMHKGKLEKLMAVFDHFHERLQRVPSPLTLDLRNNWREVRAHCAEVPNGLQRSRLAAGLEASLRQLPQVLRALPPGVHTVAQRALQAALEQEYPAFLVREQARIEAILARGWIRSLEEFEQVDSHIEWLVDEDPAPPRLLQLILLSDSFEYGLRC